MMKKRTLLPILSALLFPFASLAQTMNPNNSEWMQYLETLANDDETDQEALADLYDELSHIADHPYNLATVTKEELEKLPFLTALQIENLLYYLYKYGTPVDISELKNVDDLDPPTIHLLLPFVRIAPVAAVADAPPSLRSLRHSRHELSLRTHSTCQTKAGYRDQTYLGSPYAGSFRYNFNYRNVQFGITGEKDPGEKGLDYTTFNLHFKPDGLVEDLHLGNYRLSFGQGLVMNTHFSIGKTADATPIDLKSAGIQRHVSTNESHYFSGAAGTLHHGNLRLHLFYSLRNQDATANDSTIYTFKTDGYHRTYNDQLKRSTAQITLYGSHLQWQNRQWLLGLTAVRYSFGGKTLNPNLQPYNRFYLRGKSHANAGLHYGYRSKRLNVNGEIALDPSGKAAAVTHLNLRIASFAESVFSLRYYDRSYNALYAKGFSESNAIRNETGYYTGIRLLPFRKWELSAYIDLFYFPWLKYGVDTPSAGQDLMLRLKYNFRPDCLMEFRYRYKEKQAGDRPGQQHRWRYQCRYTPRKTWETALQIDYNRQTNATNLRQGWSCRPSFSFLPPSGTFRFDGGLLYFHTDDWDSRITLFEKNLPYTFHFPACYGHGLRYYAVLKWKIVSPLTLYLKGASTHYFDRTSIGSGPETILGREKTDVYCLIQYSF
jgi:hypothetical protein